MPFYDYFCPSNNRKVEVLHSIHREVQTWGEICQLAGCEPGDTPANAPVKRLLSAPNLAIPLSDNDYKSAGFTRLVKRDQGVYENVTAKD
ncbi:MAG: zinc ribbon domain-containing protein [Oscillatoriales cyanobacterium RM2_1_1]|nr:zinc ribbon domain-containing protein [Oscillatoriales cyanobacterium SM2_3_0]NJO44474.1 zinc ribbon domain-containing protein [Oscillatoriales cyanobacterium RM2_1_1]